MSKMKKNNIITTGDGAVVDEWVNNVWPVDAKKAITDHIPDWINTVTFRTSSRNPVISKLLDNCQLIINYNSEKNCFVVWNAAIQSQIYRANRKNAKAKLRPALGCAGERILHKKITPNFQECYYREVGRGGSNHVELIWILGNEAFVNFCQDYKRMILPDPTKIPKGKSCLYAVAGGEIQYIPSTQKE